MAYGMYFVLCIPKLASECNGEVDSDTKKIFFLLNFYIENIYKKYKYFFNLRNIYKFDFFKLNCEF